jgi:hypothetical protein
MAEDQVGAPNRHQMIRRFIDDIEKLISAHPTILSSTLQKQIGPDSRTVYVRGSITFVDLSLLELSVFGVSSRSGVAWEKYRFQYMDKKGRLVFRYDNAPHHREQPTFPHHKHLPARKSPKGCKSY